MVNLPLQLVVKQNLGLGADHSISVATPVRLHELVVVPLAESDQLVYLLLVDQYFRSHQHDLVKGVHPPMRLS